VAARRAFEYAGLETATMEELRIAIRQQLLVKETPQFGNPTYRTQVVADVVTLSRDDEDTLAGGGVVEYPYTIQSTEAPFTRCFWWRISSG
jgi:hypothetical protein